MHIAKTPASLQNSQKMNREDLFSKSVVILNNGHKMPVIGFGTYAPQKFPKSQSEEATKVAIEVGYRHIDGAYIYGNEVEVGQAIWEKIADGTIRREDVFYTGKLWSTFHTPELVQPALERSLKQLHLDYMDLFIIHMPLEMKPGNDPFPVDENGQIIFHNTDLRDTWEAMEKCVDAGLVRSIGVSNFNRRQLELILNKAGLKYKPVECHIYLNQRKLLEFCKSQDIVLVGYSVLGSSRDERWIDQNAPVVLADPVLATIAKKHNKSPAQVALRFVLQLGVVVLAKSFNPTRIKENFQVFDFNLPSEDMKELEALNRNYRYVEARQWINHPEFPFHDEY
ncbi:prostaglandin-E(2) 9-reductase-like isoform X2 [Rana temporaria]|uniref:prostaglandin-E(2) 9-reductase-like isoform X2 n=1 Tax=Rana temporaria TaxID=8407 RepID=UPI001AAD448A|nr:prostaglandin-E(2) 9-reductase-like isoform X2 [Rana temporaria]